MKIKQRLKKNGKWLGLVLLIIFGLIIINNIIVDGSRAQSFGFCNVEMDCSGMEFSGFCLGSNHYQVDCVKPNATKDDYRMIEAECGVTAYGLCNEKDYKGMDWTSDEKRDLPEQDL